MSALSIQPTFPIFTETNGLPLENGYIWIGTANLDPQTNPINVYWDAALTIAAPQPIRTLAGYPSRNGTPARLYVNSDYSIRVMNKNGSTVYSAPQATERISSDLVTYQPPFMGGVATTVQAKLAQTVSVKDFGAVGDGVVNDTAAIQAALASGAATIDFLDGEYAISARINVPNSITIQSSGGAVIKPIGGAALGHAIFNVTASNVTFDGITFDGNTDNQPISGDYSGVSLNTNSGTLTDITFKNCVLRNFDSYGVYAFNPGTLKRVRFENCRFTRFTNTAAIPPAAIQLVQPVCSEIMVDGCTFDDLTGAGFAARSVNGASPCAKVSITGCIFNHGSFLYTSIGAEIWEANGLAVSGNTFANARMGLSLFGSNIAISGNTFLTHTSYSIEAARSDGLSIAGNTFQDFQYGVILYNGADDVSITGNTFRDAASGATSVLNLGWAVQTSAATLSENYNRFVLSNNTLLNCSGFRVSRAQDFVISGNIFETTSANNLCAVRTTTNENDNVLVSGNLFRTSIDLPTIDTGFIIYAGSRFRIECNTLISTTASANVGSAICNNPSATLTEVNIENNLVSNFACGVRTTAGSPTISNVIISANQYYDCTITQTLATGTTATGKLAVSLSDIGDQNLTLTSRDSGVIRFTGTLTTDRTVTLDTTTAYRGQRFRIVRVGSGAFDLTITGLQTLLQNEWVDVVYTGSVWALCGSGSLVPRILSGTGTPEGVVTAPVGTLYTRTDGGAGTTLYVKEAGTGNTGWAAK